MKVAERQGPGNDGERNGDDSTIPVASRSDDRNNVSSQNDDNGIARTPQPPYYAVIFTSNRISSQGDEDYAATAQRMLELAAQEKGFLGVESVRDGLGVTVSYWSSLESIKHWKNNTEHLVAQDKGQKEWYASYKTRICLVERDYGY